MYKLLQITTLAFIISGCSIVDSWVYKINKQQGNITEEKSVDKLEMGMTKEQVKFILGTPMSVDSFDTNRWDYIYTLQIGNDDPIHNNLTVYFVDNKLVKIDGEALAKKRKDAAKKTADSGD